jgi:hypothetical protein
LILQDLENVYELTRHDLLVTQEALAKFQSSQQVHMIYCTIFLSL